MNRGLKELSGAHGHELNGSHIERPDEQGTESGLKRSATYANWEVTLRDPMNRGLKDEMRQFQTPGTVTSH